MFSSPPIREKEKYRKDVHGEKPDKMRLRDAIKTLMEPTMRCPNSWHSGLVRIKDRFHNTRCKLYIQAVVVEEAPFSSRKPEKRIPKQKGIEKNSVCRWDAIQILVL